MIACQEPTVQLKPRQRDALAAVMEALERGVTRQLVQLPTGVGKTILACEIARRFDRVLFLAHRDELVSQTISAFGRVDPQRGIGVLGGRRHEVGYPITIGTIQTVHARLSRMDPAGYDLLVIDEAHHAGARTWREVLDHFEPRLRLGLSATPERKDGAALSNLFDQVTYAMGVQEAIAEGYLCRPVGLQVRTGVDISKVKSVAGDFNEGQLGRVVDVQGRNTLVARTYVERCQGRRAVVFGVTVAHCQAMAEALVNRGARAEAVWGDDRERDRKVADLAAGRLDVLCNAMLLTEGWDDPAVSAVLMARPTASRVLYTQAVGRGLRTLPGKDDCLVIDFVDNAARNSLVGMFDFAGRKMRKAKDGTVDLSAPAERDAVEDAMDAWAELFSGDLNVDLWQEEFDLLAPPPEMPENPWSYGDYRWHYDQATERQLAALERAGYDVVGCDYTKGQASQLLAKAPATEAQLRLLLAMGFDALSRPWTKSQAAIALDGSNKSPDWNRVNRLRGGR